MSQPRGNNGGVPVLYLVDTLTLLRVGEAIFWKEAEVIHLPLRVVVRRETRPSAWTANHLPSRNGRERGPSVIQNRAKLPVRSTPQFSGRKNDMVDIRRSDEIYRKCVGIWCSVNRYFCLT